MLLLATLSKLLLSSLLVLIYSLGGESLSTIKCKNNGTLGYEGNKAVCHCPYPFTGQLCEDYACVNGLSNGDLYDPNSPFFSRRCLCDSGWTGVLCDVSLSNRCGDNGKEQKGECICNKNFVGDRCQYVKKCIHGQLYNGRCSCHYGWSGDFCDKIVCRQGESDERNEACFCPPKYSGRYCELCAEPAGSPSPDCSNRNNVHAILIDGDGASIVLAVVVIVALSIALGAILFFLLRYRGKESKRPSSITKRPAVGNLSLTQAKKSWLLLSSDLTIGEECRLEPEKFHDTPPSSYHNIAHHEKSKSHRVLFDSNCPTFDDAINVVSNKSLTVTD